MITADDLRCILDYNPATGVFTWRSSPNRRICIGRPAGTNDGRGYIHIVIHKRMHLAHRLAWLYVHGEWPPHEIDHVNGNPSDNRLVNLRLATRVENSRNTRRRVNNTSGRRGVYLDRSRGKWCAMIRVGGKKKNLGRFWSIEEAAEAYRAAAVAHHGEFVPHKGE